MSSWFGSAGLDLNSAFDTLTATVQNVTETVQETVSDAIPTEHKEFLAKMTLNTDDMIAERQNFGDEATRKAQAKDSLSKILPWETLDPEREILVEECKEAILELSSREDTFFGPYEMPLLKVMLEKSSSKDEDDDENLEEGTGDGEGGDADDTGEETKASRHMAPSEESQEKLSKLKPLPPLLEDFDLDSHVGFIQRVMKEDENLVEMQAHFSGGGLREKTFWRNYFFHCAFARYEAGLSLDEIWSYGEESSTTATHVETTATDGVGEAGVVSSDGNNEEIAADGSGITPQGVEELAVVADETLDLNADAAGTTEISMTELSELSPKNGFELIDDDHIGSAGDPELDELEAEIARELEGL